MKRPLKTIQASTYLSINLDVLVLALSEAGFFGVAGSDAAIT